MNYKEISEMVEAARKMPENMVLMLQKHGERAAGQISHGMLHLDFDDRNGSSWNNDLLKLMPIKLRYPVSMTSYKGNLYVHSLDSEVIDCTSLSTGEILTKIIEEYGEINENEKVNLNVNYHLNIIINH
jgi:hypothetical protein